MKRIPPEHLGFDIDGVVADTMGAFIRVARKEFGIDGIRKEEITTYWLEECLAVPTDTVKSVIQRLLDDPFGVELQPIPGAIESLSMLGELGRLTFVTARPVREPIVRWLEKMLPGVARENLKIVATGKHEAKASVLEEMGIRYFVEDHLETCRKLCRRGINAIVFDQPWNRGHTPYRRVKSWEELIGFIKLSSVHCLKQ